MNSVRRIVGRCIPYEPDLSRPMHSELAISLLSESVSGDVTERWEYQVRAEVRSLGLLSRGALLVPSHVLRPGAPLDPPVVPPLVLLAGGCGAELQVKLSLQITKADVLDAGLSSGEQVVLLRAPADGGGTQEAGAELSAAVMAVPGLKGGTGALTVKVQLSARCVEATRPISTEVWVR